MVLSMLKCCKSCERKVDSNNAELISWREEGTCMGSNCSEKTVLHLSVEDVFTLQTVSAHKRS